MNIKLRTPPDPAQSEKVKSNLTGSNNPKEMTVDDFLVLPNRVWTAPSYIFDGLILLPTNELHDSGYACMDFISVRKQKAEYRLAGGSDVLHIRGISAPLLHPIQIDWSIDCLPVSKLFHLFSHMYHLTYSWPGSSFELVPAGRRQ